VRFQRSREIASWALRLGLDRLDGLSLRPVTARLVLEAKPLLIPAEIGRFADSLSGTP